VIQTSRIVPPIRDTTSSFYELLAQGGEVECGVERVGERHPVEHRPRVEILTQDYGHLPQTGDRPDLGGI
jgi:hypothetical protein